MTTRLDATVGPYTINRQGGQLNFAAQRRTEAISDSWLQEVLSAQFGPQAFDEIAKFNSEVLRLTSAVQVLVIRKNQSRFEIVSKQSRQSDFSLSRSEQQDLLDAISRLQSSQPLTSWGSLETASFQGIALHLARRSEEFVLAAIVDTSGSLERTRIVLGLIMKEFQERGVESSSRHDLEVELLAAVLDLADSVSGAANSAEGIHLMCRLASEHLGIATVAFAERSSPQSPIRLVGWSDSKQFDRQSNFYQQLQGFCHELESQRIGNTADGSSVHPVSISAQPNSTTAVVTSFTNRHGEVKLLLGLLDLNPQKASATKALFDLTAKHGNSIWRGIEGEGFRFRTFIQRAISGRNRGVLGAAAGLLIFLFCIPMPYGIPSRAVVEPVSREFSAAPYSGVLKECYVKAGDSISEGMVLATMDDRELDWELTGVRAELDKAIQSRDQATAKHLIGESRIAALEIERLQAKMELLEQRREQLAIISPLAGTVLSAKFERSHNRPVAKGESLFELAKDEGLFVTMEIDDSEISKIRSDKQVMIRFASLPGKSIIGEIVRTSPRAETREAKNVFEAEIRIAPEDAQLLRPGMHGTAVAYGTMQPWGWTWYQRIRYQLIQWSPL